MGQPSSILDTWDLEGSAPGSAPEAPAAPAGTASSAPQCIVAGRYHLLELLGCGGFGAVYRARDLLADEDVAVKILQVRDPTRAERARAEVTALRRLRLPGVVAFRDDGQHGEHGDYFVVMDYVRGERLFPRGRVRSWDEVGPQALALVEILARVHLAGIVHRDIKPDNVLLAAHGAPVLLDFGLAVGRAIDPFVSGGAMGTIRYMSPEQVGGDEVDGRSDLYSLGVMLYEVLSGVHPQGNTTSSRMLRLRLTTPATPLAEVASEVPTEVAAVIDALLAIEPGDRPASALDVLTALGGRAPGLLTGAGLAHLPADRPATPVELRGLFRGPDPFFHLAEDGAAALHLRTGGDRRRVEAELSDWLRAGVAWWEEGRVALDRVAIRRLGSELRLGVEQVPADLDPDTRDLYRWCLRAWPDTSLSRLRTVTGWSARRVQAAGQRLVEAGLAWWCEAALCVRPVLAADPEAEGAHMLLAATSAGGSAARLRHLEAAGADADAVLEEAVAVVRNLRVEGRLGEAHAVVTAALARARASGADDREHELLVHLAKLCLARETKPAADEWLYEAGRARCRRPGLDQVEALVRAWRAIVDRDRERAERELVRVPIQRDEELEVWRGGAHQALGKLAGVAAWEQAIAALEPWAHARGGERLAKWKGWMGNLRYAQGRFSEAARLHQEAVQGKRCQDARLASLLDAAFDLLDGQDPAHAVQVARDAQDLARRLDHPSYEAQAVMVLRSAGYRAGTLTRPDPALVQAAAALGPATQGLLACTEAALAWRSGDRGLARELATAAASAFARARLAAGDRLSRALAFAVGHGDEGEGAALIDLALPGSVPGIDVQVLALVGRRCPHLLAPHLSRLRAIAGLRPSTEWGTRREILSIRECLQPPAAQD